MSNLHAPLIAAAALATTATPARATDQHITPQEAVTTYCAAWSTTDRTTRDQMLERVWAKDGIYTDAEPTYAVGRTALSDTIAKFQQDYPGNTFRCSTPQMHHNFMRVTWFRLSSDGKQLGEGVDIYDMAPDGRISRIVGFFGPAPAP
ncbi:hypothetical protein [Dyella sp. 2HG41-7]|uniref:hypothetical protein n=1 Tax=Dyella sp. 2HG41-7 TaxID=2883239 RepID=UPI001F3B358F|nr:hypothetical protein [Dyella sp. 2HG41-7]